MIEEKMSGCLSETRNRRCGHEGSVCPCLVLLMDKQRAEVHCPPSTVHRPQLLPSLICTSPAYPGRASMFVDI